MGKHWQTIADTIFRKYQNRFGDIPQGCCLLIADEISRLVGGDVVAGELTWYGGSCRRTHWWVEKDGVVLDPMGDYFLSFEDYPGRTEIHKDAALFKKLLPEYEQWRIGGGSDLF